MSDLGRDAEVSEFLRFLRFLRLRNKPANPCVKRERVMGFGQTHFNARVRDTCGEHVTRSRKDAHSFRVRDGFVAIFLG